MKIFLVVKVLDVNYNPHDAKTVSAQFEGTDPGAGAFDLTGTGAKGVFEIEIPAFVDLFAVNVDEPGFFPVHQQLKLVKTGAAPALEFSGKFQEINIRNIGGNSRGADFAVEVYVVLGQLRNCRDFMEVLAARFPPTAGKASIFTIDPIENPVLDFTGLTVLNPGGTGGWNSMIHNPIAAVTPTGRMFYIERTATPKLIGVYVPDKTFFTRARDSVDPQTKPINFHLFYHPSPSHMKGSYPFSFAFLDLICRYSFYFPFLHKEMTNQQEASGKKQVFVFPVGEPATWMDKFGSQASILRLLQELTYYLQRKDQIPYPLQPVGKCIVSGFSAGGAYVKQALGGDNKFFHDNVLHEVYGFDLRQEAPSTFASLLKRWWRQGADGRCFRLYTTDRSRWDATNGIDGTAGLTQGSGGALEKTGVASTVLFVPVANFWVNLDPEHPPTPSHPAFRPIFNRKIDDVHQMMPALFMQHALKHSTL